MAKTAMTWLSTLGVMSQWKCVPVHMERRDVNDDV